VNDKPQDIEQWLTALGNPSADRDYKPGHERLLTLLSHLSLHRPQLRIRVAGTNGKGSTSSMLAAALEACGFKVGLYTSPHILKFNERIRINGTSVSTPQLMHSLATLMPIALEVGASYFETATALALHQFSQAHVDVEILEAGVGARLDATTAVDADMAVITPIALDHQNWLGDTLAEIAGEKAYAMQGCRYNISAPQCSEVAEVLRIFHADIVFSDSGNDWIDLSAAGLHQRSNAALAWSALQQLQVEYPMDSDAAHQAIVHCKIPGRLQHIQVGNADVWLDAAHNNHAIEALLPSLQIMTDSFKQGSFDTIIVLTRADRSLNNMLAKLQRHTIRLISNDDPSQACDTISPAQLLRQQIKQNPHGHYLVLGSFTTVAAILTRACD